MSEITVSISRMLTQYKSLPKTLGKNYSFQAGNFQTCSAQQEKNLKGRKVSMGVFPDYSEKFMTS